VLFNQGMNEEALYHMQQSTEKHLKAFLSLNHEKINKNHDIAALINQCAKIDNDFLSIDSGGQSTQMTQLASYYRYPNADENDYSTHEDVTLATSFLESTKLVVLLKTPQIIVDEIEVIERNNPRRAVSTNMGMP